MENNEMNFEDFATDLTEVRANLFALNIEIRELKQKIDEVNRIIRTWGNEILYAKICEVHNKPRVMENDVDNDCNSLVSKLCSKEKMQD